MLKRTNAESTGECQFHPDLAATKSLKRERAREREREKGNEVDIRFASSIVIDLISLGLMNGQVNTNDVRI